MYIYYICIYKHMTWAPLYTFATIIRPNQMLHFFVTHSKYPNCSKRMKLIPSLSKNFENMSSIYIYIYSYKKIHQAFYVIMDVYQAIEHK